MSFLRSLVAGGCPVVLVVVSFLQADTGDAIAVEISTGRIEVEAPECLTLLFNRMTPIPVRMKNLTGKEVELEITTRSDVLGLVPFREGVADGGNGEGGELVLIPLMAGEWEGDLILTSGDRTRSWTQRFCVLPPARLHARVRDSNDRVAPAWVRVTGADGREYTPDGHDAGEFRTEGLFELLVPAGPATISVRSADGGAPARKTQVDLPVNRTVFVELALP